MPALSVHPDFSTEIPAPDYDVVVFENQFPSFSDRIKPDEIPRSPQLVPVRPGVGRCEVVCFTSDHNSSFGALPAPRVRTVLDALADRTTEMSALPGVAQVFPFENRGIEIGVTLSHPHGQIYAYPMVPPRTQAMLAAAATPRPGPAGAASTRTCWPPSRRRGHASSRPTSTGRRTCRPRPAGPSRSSSPRTARCPTSRP